MSAQSALWGEDERPAMVARPYQAGCIAAIAREHARVRSTLAVLATGCGKTFVAGEVAKVTPGRALFLAHTDALVTQARAALERITGVAWALEQGPFRAPRLGSDNVIASVQSLHKTRLETFAADAFALVIVDEAHHYTAKSFSKVIAHFPAAKVLGITATPDRGDGQAMGRIFETVAYRMDLADAIEQAWSTPLSVGTYQSHVSLDGVAFSRSLGDFAAGALDEEIAKAAAPIKEAVLRLAGQLCTAVFTPGVKSAHAVAGAINEEQPGSARAIDGGMPRHEVRATIEAFKRGEFLRIINCLMLTEGFDHPGIQCIVDAAPTTSRSRFVQKIGRGTRLWEGIGDLPDAEQRRAAIAASPKPVIKLIDLAFSSSKHPLAGPVDILGGNYTDDEQKRAKKALAKAGGDVDAALRAAREETQRRALRAQAAAAAKVTLEAMKAQSPKTSAGEWALTPGQERRLTRYGIPFDGETTKRAANKMIGFEVLCEQRKWCNYRQRQFLETWTGAGKGYGRGLPVTAGKAITDAWRAAGKLRLSRAQIDAAVSAAK